MRSGGTGLQGCSLLNSVRIHLCKAVILALIIFIFLQYATNLFVYREPIHKMVAPGLAWFSSSLNHKFRINEEKMPPVWESGQPCVNKCNIVNSNASKLSNISEPLSVKCNLNGSSKIATSHEEESLEECPLVPPKLG